jgi:integrase
MAGISATFELPARVMPEIKMTSTRTNRYQQGTVERVHRAKGPDAWVFRWREVLPNGKRVQRKRVIGTVTQYKTLSAARSAVENLRLEINAAAKPRAMTVGEAWGHFQAHELRDPDVGRSHTTIAVYEGFFRAQILPRWKDVPIDEVRPIDVEKWLRSLSHLAPATRAKSRNLMSALFSHLIRHELYTRLNPIASVRQSATRRSEPAVLTVDEIRSIIDQIEAPPVKVMVIVAACSALRRSEIRGLKWSDLDLENGFFKLRRGFVRKGETAMKTEASRKDMPMIPELAATLLAWRNEAPYNQDDDWVFASPYTKGERPYWADIALNRHVRPAAKRAGITKRIGWHTFRHSLATLLGNKGEQVKVVQTLLRHSSSQITADLYQHGDADVGRQALAHTAPIFANTPTAIN